MNKTHIKKHIYEQGYFLERGRYKWRATPLNPALGHRIHSEDLEGILNVILCLKGTIYA